MNCDFIAGYFGGRGLYDAMQEFGKSVQQKAKAHFCAEIFPAIEKFEDLLWQEMLCVV